MVFKIIEDLEQWNRSYPKFHLDTQKQKGKHPWIYVGIYLDDNYSKIIGSFSAQVHDRRDFKDHKTWIEKTKWANLPHFCLPKFYGQNCGQVTLDLTNKGYTAGTGMGTEIINSEKDCEECEYKNHTCEPQKPEKDCETCEYKNHICEPKNNCEECEYKSHTCAPEKDCENCEYKNHVCEPNEAGTGNGGNNGSGNNNGTGNGDNETPIEFEKIGKFWEDNFIRPEANPDIGKRWENNLIRTVKVDANIGKYWKDNIIRLVEVNTDIGKMWEENLIFIEEEEE
ncbi:MAG: hypothetical protein LBH98_08820 [Chitinispirillales bacterium]|jgi:hypothetical protein|nr:hypothetical protein [Chitinispirillales bacterium]